MLASAAKTVAWRWVYAEAADDPLFRAAFFAGSIIELSDSDELRATSDIDIVVLIDGVVPPKLGKFCVEGTLLEVTYLPWSEFSDLQIVAGLYYLAPSFASDQIIADPTGHLSSVRDAISTSFTDLAQIRRRCDAAANRLIVGLDALDALSADVPWHERITAFIFPASLTTHVVLVAALRNPTVRLRFLAVRDVLLRHAEDTLYRQLLDLLGCAEVAVDLVQHHLDELAGSFDGAAALASTSFFFSSDISPVARSVAIDGSQELIDVGDHREAVFWVIATFARCIQILTADGSPEQRTASAAKFAAAVSDLLGLHDLTEVLEPISVLDATPAAPACAVCCCDALNQHRSNLGLSRFRRRRRRRLRCGLAWPAQNAETEDAKAETNDRGPEPDQLVVGLQRGVHQQKYDAGDAPQNGPESGDQADVDLPRRGGRSKFAGGHPISLPPQLCANSCCSASVATGARPPQTMRSR